MSLDRNYLVNYIGGLEELRGQKTLRLTAKNISNINPNSFQNLKQLEAVFLSHNKITALHENTFVELTKLRILILKSNNIKIITLFAFAGLSNLEQLDLEENQIEVIVENSFSHLTRLKQLSLNKNKLKTIGPKTFNGLKSLKNLFLDENQLQKIDANAFSQLSNLVWLRIDQNKLKEVDQNCFVNLKEIALIELYKNGFDSKIVSYFSRSKTIPYYSPNTNSTKDPSKIEEILNNNGGYLTNLNDFLQQFHSNYAIHDDSDYDSYNFSGSANSKSATRNTNKSNTEHVEKYTSKYETQKINPQVSQLLTEIDELKYEIEQLLMELRALKDEKEKKESEYESTINKLFSQKFQNERKKKNDNISTVDSYDRYTFKSVLGTGTYGTALLVEDSKIKIKDKKKDEKETITHLKKVMKMIEIRENDNSAENEFSLYLRISHENVLKYFDHFQHEQNGIDYICIMIEYCEKGDFEKLIRNARHKKKLIDCDILDWITQATNGLKYLHSKKIIHRDINPKNLLLTNDNVVKVADLGISKCVEYTKGKTYIGTIRYMSPEISRGQKKGFLEEDDEECDDYEIHSYNTDVWSLGCVLYELKFLKYAFRSGKEGNPNPDIPELRDSGYFADVLKKMFEKDPKERISSEELYAELVEIKSLNSDVLIG